MEWFSKTLMLLMILVLQFSFNHSQSIVNTLPGFSGQLPFLFETGYVGIGEREEAQFFYYFVESQGNPNDDPLIFHLTGGPGCSAVLTFFNQIGPLNFKFGNASEDTTLILNPYSWTQMANVIFVDMPVGTGFAYATTKEASISSDAIMAKQANEFLRKFLIDHPKFLKNPLYISGISYMGIVTPTITLELYNANERGDQPMLNIQGYILCNPLTDKFMDFNSRFEFAHRMALISDDIYKSAVENCRGDYLNTAKANSLCLDSLQRYEECTSRIDLKNILDPVCDKTDPKPPCQEYYYNFIIDWANKKAVQQALNVREGMIGKWELFNNTLHYQEGKNDTSCYSYDIFSSFTYHMKLVSKDCRALIFSGDHDMTFPYVGVEKWISALNLGLDSPWKPFYVDAQVGGYEMAYAHNDFYLTYATVKGAGHSVTHYKPKEAMALLKKWLATEAYRSTM
ncbi:serine carboxypeptidase-like 16 [Artemisia annua]|uniref:Serine carboxypeptidase-like 16 n=1 Tax=Artemisia annua TaxID=35608 RepID=A0A2U1KGQ7_ARTAN|nr:serine carboxypeptidase-like 16 [Artemisia annua]